MFKDICAFAAIATAITAFNLWAPLLAAILLR